MSTERELVSETLGNLCDFVSAMPYSTEGMEAVHAIIVVLRQNDPSHDAFIKAVAEEMDDDDDDSDDSEDA